MKIGQSISYRKQLSSFFQSDTLVRKSAPAVAVKPAPPPADNPENPDIACLYSTCTQVLSHMHLHFIPLTVIGKNCFAIHWNISFAFFMSTFSPLKKTTLT